METRTTNVTPISDAGTCPHCGQSTNGALEQFLEMLGISEDRIKNLKTSIENVNVEEYLDTARDYLRTSGDKAKSFAKKNPGKVAAGVAAVAVGAGLVIAALNRD